jgi:nucleoside phosphorylase
MRCAVILTALPVEYLAVREFLTGLQEKVNLQGTVYEQGVFAGDGFDWKVGIAEVGAGNVEAAIEAERAIDYFKPDVLLFVGIAGGLKNDVAIGDVVAATKVYGYESGKAEEVFKPRPEVRLAAYRLAQRARAEARNGDWLRRIAVTEVVPRVFVAPIAAGEKVVASTESEVYEFLRSNYNDAIAVEMEGSGFLSAAFAYPSIKAIVIRGISDMVAGKNDDAGQGKEVDRHKVASNHASSFAFELLAKLQLEDKAPNMVEGKNDDAGQGKEVDRHKVASNHASSSAFELLAKLQPEDKAPNVLSNPLKIKILSLLITLLAGSIPSLQSCVINIEQAAVSIARDLYPQHGQELTIVHTGKESLDANSSEINKPSVNKNYLARLINKLSQSQVRAIAIHNAFDSSYFTNSQLLEKALDNVSNKKIDLLLGHYPLKVPPSSLSHLRKGNIDLGEYAYFPQYLQPSSLNNIEAVPFAYSLAMMIQARTVSNNDSASQVSDYNSKIAPSLSFQWLVSPIIDYSKPPDRIYSLISDKQLLEISEDDKAKYLKDRVALIAFGEIIYSDNHFLPMPLPITMWSSFGPNNDDSPERRKKFSSRSFTDAEVHAYIAHQLMNNSIIFRVNDWVVILLTILILGYYTSSPYYHRKSCKIAALTVSTLVLFCVIPILYCVFNLAIPFSLPLTVYIIYYISPGFSIKQHHVKDKCNES